MKMYKIYVGLTHKNGVDQVPEQRIDDIVKLFGVPAITKYWGSGLWDGKAESTIILETDSVCAPDLAKALQIAMHQECVLLTEQEISATLIS